MKSQTKCIYLNRRLALAAQHLRGYIAVVGITELSHQGDDEMFLSGLYILCKCERMRVESFQPELRPAGGVCGLNCKSCLHRACNLHTGPTAGSAGPHTGADGRNLVTGSWSATRWAGSPCRAIGAAAGPAGRLDGFIHTALTRGYRARHFKYLTQTPKS